MNPFEKWFQRQIRASFDSGVPIQEGQRSLWRRIFRRVFILAGMIFAAGVFAGVWLAVSIGGTR